MGTIYKKISQQAILVTTLIIDAQRHYKNTLEIENDIQFSNCSDDKAGCV